MNPSPKPKSSLAVKTALDVIGPCHPNTAAYLLFLASSAHLARTFGKTKAAELLYSEADRFVTEGAP